MVNGLDVASGSTTYTTDSLQQGDIVSFFLQSDAICVLDSTVTSNAINMTVNPLPVVDAIATVVPIIGVIAIKDTLCEGESLILSGIGAQNYTWSNTVADGVAFPALNTQTYTVTGTDGNGCSSTISKLIVVNPRPIVSISSLDPDYCDTISTVALTGSPLGGTFIGVGVSGNSFSPQLMGQGIYPISYNYTDSNGCTDSTFASINILDCSIFTSIENEVVVDKILAYPNPVQNYMNLDIEFGQSTVLNVKILDVLGHVIFQEQFSQTGLYQLDLEQLLSGSYILQIVGDNNQRTQKVFIKE
ncbi:MAG: T9SS type A sorting domain-containing protein [Aureispira sp.]|nr:T9SS type A sorting domain-containing protein [Aureispira sp.]